MEIKNSTNFIYAAFYKKIFLIEATNDRRVNRLIKKKCNYYIRQPNNHFLGNYKLRIIKEKNVRSKLLAKCLQRKLLSSTTERLKTLQNRISEKRKYHNSDAKLIAFVPIKNEIEYSFIIIEEEFRENSIHTIENKLESFFNILIKEDQTENSVFDTHTRFCHIIDEEISIETESERKKIEYLIAQEFVINDMFPELICDLSPIYIDGCYNISFPLYAHLNLKLDPLPKSIYILFLRHPEGIVLKEFSDYCEELREIYCTISRKQNPSAIRRTLDDLGNPVKNLLNKNLSLIRSSILRVMNIEAAGFYIPIRGRGNAKCVKIDKTMIHLSFSIGEKIKLTRR